MQVIARNGTLVEGPSPVLRRMLFAGAKAVDPVPRSPRPVPPGHKVRVLALVHGWFPNLAAGSERMMQHLLDSLPKDEYDIHVLSFGIGDDPESPSEYEYQGLPITRGFDPPFEPDLIILHHGFAARVAQAYADEFPHVSIVVVHHNERYDTEDLKAINADLHVFNTRWVKDGLGMRGVVVHPPLEPERHAVAETGDAVTLINLQDNKGVHRFYDLADRHDLRHDSFLGVIGTHGPQVFPGDDESTHGVVNGNVEIHPTTQDMREVWARTKVLLMPSGYESYGMCAAEAAINGIPTIAHPTPGLVECLGNSGIFIDRDDIDAYARMLRLLLTDATAYRMASDLARERGRELVKQTTRELRKFEREIRKLVRE